MANTIEKMKTLTYKDFVKVAAWVASGKQVNAYSMFTIEGYAAKYGQDGAEAYALAVANHHETAGVLNSGSALVGGKGRFAYYAARDKELADAIELLDGELVRIEGRIYIVHFVGSNYADPIKFTEVKA